MLGRFRHITQAFDQSHRSPSVPKASSFSTTQCALLSNTCHLPKKKRPAMVVVTTIEHGDRDQATYQANTRMDTRYRTHNRHLPLRLSSRTRHRCSGSFSPSLSGRYDRDTRISHGHFHIVRWSFRAIWDCGAVCTPNVHSDYFQFVFSC